MKGWRVRAIDGAAFEGGSEDCVLFFSLLRDSLGDLQFGEIVVARAGGVNCLAVCAAARADGGKALHLVQQAVSSSFCGPQRSFIVRFRLQDLLPSTCEA